MSAFLECIEWKLKGKEEIWATLQLIVFLQLQIYIQSPYMHENLLNAFLSSGIQQ